MSEQAAAQPILVATDLSSRSDRAMHRAFDLARQENRPVVVITVLDDAMPADMTEMLHTKAKAELDRFVASLNDGVDSQIEVLTGDPTEEMLKAAAAHAPYLLVMGVHRPRPFLDLLRETTMQRVVRRTAVPVLLVRDTVDHPYAKVVAACDFSPASTGAIRMACDLSSCTEITPVHALHVPYAGMLAGSGAGGQDLTRAFQKEAEEAEAAWRESQTLPEAVGDTRIITGPAFGVVQQVAMSTGADLICVGAHGRVGAAPAILGSLASDLMRDAPCDLLIARG